MTLFGHLTVATAGFLLVEVYVWPSSEIVIAASCLGVTLLFCLLPDIDHPNSTIGKRVKWLSWPITLLFGHRGITHSLSIVLVFLFCTYEYMTYWWVKYAFLGYMLHLLGDYLTPAGIPLFYPQKKCFRFPFTVRTGGVGEFIISMGLFVAALLLFLGEHYA